MLPASFDSARTYPVIVMFPASSGTALSLFESYQPPEGAIVVLSAGQGSPDLRTGYVWTRTIARYDQQLRADLAALARERRADTTRVVLAGFSMGGDLAWALALRNPQRVRGAVVMSSRARYRARATDMRTLAANGARFFLTIGGAEDPTRRAGALAAARLLDSLQIANRFREISGAGHARAPAEIWEEALAYVLRRD
ncbi:MAG: alpha/beta hydrolase [Gemmatimonadales bacterium]|nr:alpha/beta hydrolase [Gemmatimonadales bacterium]